MIPVEISSSHIDYKTLDDISALIEYIKLVDFEKIENNQFLVVDQFTININL